MPFFAPSLRGDFIFWLDPKNETKKIKAPDRFEDFLQVLPACAAKLRTGHNLYINIELL